MTNSMSKNKLPEKPNGSVTSNHLSLLRQRRTFSSPGTPLGSSDIVVASISGLRFSSVVSRRPTETSIDTTSEDHGPSPSLTNPNDISRNPKCQETRESTNSLLNKGFPSW